MVDEQTRGLWAISPGGATTLAVWHQVPESTESDRARVSHPFAYRPEVAVAEARGLVEARRGRPPEITEDQWQSLLATVWPELTEEQKQNADEILRAVLRTWALDEVLDELADRRVRAKTPRKRSGAGAAVLGPRKRGRKPWTRWLFEERYEEALLAAKAEAGSDPGDVRIVEKFRGLDGEVGQLTPDHLADLRRRWRRGELPE